MSSVENRYLEIPVVLFLLAGAGGWMMRRLPSHPARAMLAGLLAGLGLMLVQYRFRFVSGQGLLGISLLSGLALSRIVAKFQASWSRRVQGHAWIVPALVTVSLFGGHTTWFVPEGFPRVAVCDASASNLIHPRPDRGFGATSFYYPGLIEPLVRAIRQHTQADDIIGCNLPYACGMLSALAHRALAIGMFAEARAPGAWSEADALHHAHLLIWFKTEPLPGTPSLEALQRRWDLSMVEETDTAYVLRNPQAREFRRRAKAVVPLWLAQGIFWTLVVLSIRDLRRHPSPV